MSAQTPPALWPVIAQAHAAVAPHVTATERHERGRAFVVVRNESSGVHVQIDLVLWRFVQALDGRLSVVDLLDSMAASNTAPQTETEHDKERLAKALVTLEQAGILSTGLPGAARRQWIRSEAQRKASWRKRWANPLALRLPLHDPSTLMTWLEPKLGALATRSVALVWAAIVLLAFVTMFTAWSGIGEAFASLARSPRQWLSVLLIWPILKLVHELAHALAIHRYGGRVHEWGITFLVLMPVPYVDASDASLFSRRQRLVVGAAGMLAELTIAAMALLLWNLFEAGLLRDLMFAVVVAGSINTLLFNANPLLKFDGYYLLEDASGLRNLASRASRWWLAWIQLRLFGIPMSGATALESIKDRRWLASYGLLSLMYRYVVVVGITLWLLDTVPLIGMGLAMFAIWPLCIKPVVSSIRWLWISPVLDENRMQAFRRAGICLAVVVFVTGVVPLPSTTRVTGVVAVDGTASLTAPEAGRLIVLANHRVNPGELLARIDAPDLQDESQLLSAERERLSSTRVSVARTDALEARLLDEELSVLAQREEALAERVSSLDIRAQKGGRFVPVDGESLVGRLLKPGDPIGQVVDARALRVRAIVEERQLERLRDGVLTVKVRLAESILEPVEAHLVREMPSANHELPSAALAGKDGIAVAEVNDRLETLEPVFHVELGLPEELDVAGVGGRAYVTFKHPAESLATRWWRLTRQLFLERLVV